MLNIFFGSFLYLSGLFTFIIERKHLLLMLLSLEYIVVSLFLLIFYNLMINFDYFFCMIFLTMSVCESVLGLSILVFMIRNHGNDYVLSFSSLW
ncbi:NADH dehydrogenase subunit 4L (mitochondrion) [Sitophilus oryzae]|uniref:NADH-ubiquinone oxidoreductase chain 4L n=1 Tax=Sitophilus oryzae TaxID=7048 RepID=A0A1B1UUM3_SITOR|nr:NADH dehydrogenase subunit 4L [Sitophilus oryzae]ANW06529.1 NADH dehydrogenase subunit 4L [Sitophilus oryzae]AQD17672.1 NADH dehydrogenase subunit 4L [Sitophilus oryzae]